MLWLKGFFVFAVVSAAWLSWHQHETALIAKGHAEAMAAVETARAEAEKRNAALEAKGRELAEQLAAMAQQRLIAVQKQLAQAKAERQKAADDLARVDAEYRAWRDVFVPAMAAERLRKHADSLAPAAGSGDMPAGLQAGQGTASSPITRP